MVMLYVKTATQKLQKVFVRNYNSLIRLVNRFPLRSFFGLLTALFILILLANWLGKAPQSTENSEVVAKAVPVFHLGTLPKLSFTGQVKKSGTITITAQGSGIVAAIPAPAGTTVRTGQRLLSLASNYQGGNAASTQRQIAAATYAQVQKNLPLQQNIIAQNRTIAEQSQVNTDQLRKISSASLQNTTEMIAASKNALRGIDDLISTQEQQPSAAINDLTLASLRQQRIGLLSGLTSAEQSLSNTAYSTSGGQAPAALSRLTKETTLKQLDLEARNLMLNAELSQLNLRLTSITEATMFPVAPFAGTVAKVHVKVGEQVSPGTPLISFSGQQQSTTVEVSVPAQVAPRLSRTEFSTLTWNQQNIELVPQAISGEPTTGNLVAVTFMLPEGIAADTLTDGQFITVQIPLGATHGSLTTPYIPLDAIYQTENVAYILVIKDGKAQPQEIEVGQVYNGYVEVVSGIDSAIDIILDRGIIAGAAVSPA